MVCCACSAASGETVATPAGTHAQASLVAVTQEDAHRDFLPEELGNALNGGMCYHNIAQVSVWLDNREFSLEEALSGGQVTVADLRSCAEQDMKDGICIQKTQESRYGVNNVTYYYSDFDLTLVDDVLEAPDGKQYPICFVGVSNHLGSGHKAPLATGFLDPETGANVLLEDWGVTFQVDSFDGQNLTFHVTQSGGMQAGTLELTLGSLRAPDGTAVSTRDDSIFPETPLGEITPDSTTSFTIDLSQWYPLPLESGAYSWNLTVKDVYDQNTLHPLMRKYQDRQQYTMEFRVD